MRHPALRDGVIDAGPAEFTNPVDAENAQFYGRFPYPWRPASFTAPEDPDLTRRMICQDVGDWDHRALPRAPRIWVAGCGTNQAVITSMCHPQATIIGSDVSTTSLELTAKTLQELGLSNVILRRESLVEARWEEAFDLIICTGVIHHLADPVVGLRRLAVALKPDGILELMVYNQYHRLLSTVAQQAVKSLLGDDRRRNLDESLALTRRFVRGLPARNLLSEYLSQLENRPEAMVADSLQQPVEHSYTVQSLAALANAAGLRILAYRPNEFDHSANRAGWNLEWPDPAIGSRYRALPDLERWQVTQWVLLNDSPMLWFYLQRRVTRRPVLSEREIADGFLARCFVRTEACQIGHVRRPDGTYQRIEGARPWPASLARPIVRSVLPLCDGRSAMREVFSRAGVQDDLSTVGAARMHLASSIQPLLQTAP
jgi:SAM-dependent methyltransferase